jgi:hypothetical protein
LTAALTAPAEPDTAAADRMSAAAPATSAEAAATSEDITAAADVGIGRAGGVKAVATTAAALREKCVLVKEGPLPGHQFLSRGELHWSVILRNLQRNSVGQRI